MDEKKYIKPSQYVEDIAGEELICDSSDHHHGRGWDKDGDGEKDHGRGPHKASGWYTLETNS